MSTFLSFLALFLRKKYLYLHYHQQFPNTFNIIKEQNTRIEKMNNANFCEDNIGLGAICDATELDDYNLVKYYLENIIRENIWEKTISFTNDNFIVSKLLTESSLQVWPPIYLIHLTFTAEGNTAISNQIKIKYSEIPFISRISNRIMALNSWKDFWFLS